MGKVSSLVGFYSDCFIWDSSANPTEYALCPTNIYGGSEFYIALYAEGKVDTRIKGGGQEMKRKAFTLVMAVFCILGGLLAISVFLFHMSQQEYLWDGLGGLFAIYMGFKFLGEYKSLLRKKEDVKS